MLITKELYVSLHGPYLKHYEDLGYPIPWTKKQRYEIRHNGKIWKAGTYKTTGKMKLLVKVDDLPKCSHYPVIYQCDKCGEKHTVGYNNYIRCKKETDLCVKCTRTKDFANAHETWVRKLIINNPDAKCDICGETDKRFLVLHHIDGRVNNKSNERDGYVILSANYHVAFHKFLGSTRVRSTKEKYKEFKQQELKSLYGGDICRGFLLDTA